MKTNDESSINTERSHTAKIDSLAVSNFMLTFTVLYHTEIEIFVLNRGVLLKNVTPNTVGNIV